MSDQVQERVRDALKEASRQTLKNSPTKVLTQVLEAETQFAISLLCSYLLSKAKGEDLNMADSVQSVLDEAREDPSTTPAYYKWLKDRAARIMRGEF